MSGEKCSATSMCKTMLRKVIHNDNGKGLVAVHTERLSTGEEFFLGVAYKTSARDRGLMLNVCPWCRGEPGTFARAVAKQAEGTEP